MGPTCKSKVPRLLNEALSRHIIPVFGSAPAVPAPLRDYSNAALHKQSFLTLVVEQKVGLVIQN